MDKIWRKAGQRVEYSRNAWLHIHDEISHDQPHWKEFEQIAWEHYSRMHWASQAINAIVIKENS